MFNPQSSTCFPQARTAQPRKANARRPRTAAKQAQAARASPSQILCDHLARLAARDALGAVGLAGAHALGIVGPQEPLDVLVWADLAKVDALGEELAEAAETVVRIYDAARLPWPHRLHLCVRWVNVAHLPRIEVPMRATSRVIYPNGAEALVALSSVPHFAPVERPQAQPTGRFVRSFPPPPIGGFLI